MYLWHDGNVKREEEIRISPFDHGYLYGMGVFETFRTYEGHPFLFDDHIERLQMSCAAIGIQLPYGREQLLRAVEDLYRVYEEQDLYIRLKVSRGARDIGLSSEPYAEPTVLLYAKPIGQRQPGRTGARDGSSCPQYAGNKLSAQVASRYEQSCGETSFV